MNAIAIITSQCPDVIGVQLKKSPPTIVNITWTTTIIPITFKKLIFSLICSNIFTVLLLTLNPLNTAQSTNIEKYAVICSSVFENIFTKNGVFKNIKLKIVTQAPANRIWFIIVLETILWVLDLGFSNIYFLSAGSEPKAKAPSPSITKLIHSICVILSGSSIPKNGAIAQTATAPTFIVNWNLINFKILL